jgi:hypothetical protein
MDLFFLLGTTITKADRIEGLLPNYTAKGVTFYESFRTRLAKLYAATMVFIEKNARR